jgi:hypothetical protein
VGKLEGKKALRRPRRKAENNINLGLMEIVCSASICLMIETNGMLVNAVINPRVPERCWEILEQLSNWRLLKKRSPP